MELGTLPTFIAPPSPDDPALDSLVTEKPLQSVLESPQEIADLLQVLARSVFIFGLSALYLAEQVNLRVCAFDAWATTIERKLEPKLEQNYESLDAEEEVYDQFLSFRLQKAERLEALRGHFDAVRKLFRLCIDEELQGLVVDDAITIAYIVAWIVITGAEELKNVLDKDQQEGATAAFVRAVRDDTLECRQMSKHNQKKLELGHFTYHEICRELLDDLSLHLGMSTDSIFSKKFDMNHYSLTDFLDSSSNRFPMPSGMKKALQFDFPHTLDEPILTIQATEGEEEELPGYDAPTSTSEGPSFETVRLPTYTQVMEYEKLVPKVTMPKLLSSDRTFANLKIASDVACLPGLQPAISALELIYNSAKEMPLHRGLAAVLILQCDEVLVTIRDSAGKADKSNLQAAINKTIETFTAIRLDMAKWSKYSTWRCWWERHTIEDKLQEYSILIRHSLDILGLAANLDGVSDTTKGKGKAKSDQPQLSDVEHEMPEIHNLVSQLRNTRISNAPGSVLRPPDLDGEVQKIGEHPLWCGSTSDTYKGLYLGKMFVAMKVLRGPGTSEARPQDIRRFERQLDLWKTMYHKHVLNLVGYCLVNGNHMCLVTPWMENRDVLWYLHNNPEADRFKLITEVAIGLEYLHSIDILHGGLQSNKILVDNEGHAVLSSFSLSKLLTDDEPTFYTLSAELVSEIRYQGPEVMGGQPLDTSSDVYSWAMCALEIMTGYRPFHYIKPIGRLIRTIIAHQFPEKRSYPSPITESYVGLWELFERCCNGDPKQRPSITQVLQNLEEIKARKGA
ncbi:hypothetical protein FRC03_011285 [Tulasnella sp. 419]|nr:hypothetical protein FRC03_011285 [Tulasnella sp. 419]